MNDRNAKASGPLSSAAIAAFGVFLLFSGPITDCCPLAVMVSAQTEHACCLDSDEMASTTITTATAETIRDRADSGWRALGVDESSLSSPERCAHPQSVLTLPPARAVLTVRLRI